MGGYNFGVDEPDPLGLVGQTVRGSWFVERLVHEGSLSHIYEVHRETDGVRAALKCYAALADLPDPLRNNLRSSFITVGKIVAQLARAYDGLVRPLGGGWLDLPSGSAIPCIILEWLDGNTLEALLDAERGRIRRTVGEVLHLMAGPLEVLAAAHQFGLVHRDIKPSNFYVIGDAIERGAQVRLLDLNMAKQGRSAEESVPRPSVLFMTPHYAAPEQFRGDDPLIGPWTDVFGLALVFLELMAGYGPAMRGETLEELRQASEDRDRRPTPRELGLDVSNAVEAVFRRALAVDVGERFRNAGAFARQLHAAAEADGRVTSSAISRVSGVLDFDTTPDARMRPNPPTGTVIAPHPPPDPRPAITGQTVISHGPPVSPYTVLTPPYRKPDE